MSDEEEDGEPEPYDEIGKWSEVKLEIIRKYASAFSTIVGAQKFTKVYIDGFAGAGMHVSKSTGAKVTGSPLNALAVAPPFDEFHFVEKNPKKVAHLREFVADRSEAKIHVGDCNEILPRDVLPTVRYKDFRRALCLLDPYGLHLRWEVVAKAGEMGTIDVLINFPVMDMNMNALFWDSSKVNPAQAARMTAFWGNETWHDATYKSLPGLFGAMEEKNPNEAIVEAYRKRLLAVGGFKFVSRPLAMVQKTLAPVYYLLLASQREVAVNVMNSITKRYPHGGGA